MGLWDQDENQKLIITHWTHRILTEQKYVRQS